VVVTFHAESFSRGLPMPITLLDLLEDLGSTDRVTLDYAFATAFGLGVSLHTFGTRALAVAVVTQLAI
jgi:hypothetical protein